MSAETLPAPLPGWIIEQHPTLGRCATKHERDSMHAEWAVEIRLFDAETGFWVVVTTGIGSSRSSAREDAGFEVE